MKAGLATLGEVEQIPADLVLDAYEYATFLDTYRETHAELNKPTK